MTWPLASLAVLGLGLALGALWYEHSSPNARILALVATLAALAALGRIAFAPLPNVKPTTDIVLLSGYVLGGAPGFMVGAVAALASNLFFGQGPWTPWQMAGWGLVGLLGAALARVSGRRLGRIPLAVACLVAGFLYGAVMNLYLWVTFSGTHSRSELLAYAATSLPFDVAHAVGNLVFCLAFGPVLVRALQRCRARLQVTWPAPARIAIPVAALVAVALGGGGEAATAQAAVPRESVQYLVRAQNADGGFGGAPGQRSSQMQTGWSALGLAAAGRHPRDVSKHGNDPLDYIRRNAGALRGDLGERTRTVLVLRAAGVSPRSFAGRDFTADIRRAQRSNGSFSGRVNTTSFALLALRAAGHSPRHPAIARGAGFIASQANDDGGFNFDGRGAESGVDDTGAAIQALVAAGRRRSPAVSGALTYLARSQNRDGGFAIQSGGPSNAQSTAWAVQGLVAAGRNPDSVRTRGSRSPLQYLRSLVGSDGAIRYSRTSAQTPVWVTAQAITALARKPFPLAPVRRAGRSARGAAAPSAAPAPKAGARPDASSAATSATGAATAPDAAGASERPAARRSAARRRDAPPPGRVRWSPNVPPSELAQHARTAGLVLGSLGWPLN